MADNQLLTDDPGWAYGDVLPLRRKLDSKGQPTGELEWAIPEAIKGAVNSGYNALVGPGETLTGKNWLTGATTGAPDQGKLANDLAGTMLGLGTGLGAAPEGSLGVFAGQRAATANLNSLAEAQRFATYPRITAKEIWQKTGWFQGSDGQWRFEIPDTAARLKTGGAVDLTQPMALQGPSSMGKILDHPELYRAYPQLKNTPVIPMAGSGALGEYNPEEKIIALGKQPAGEMLSTTLHETQHGIQDIERFATGGPPDQFLPEDYWERGNAAVSGWKIMQKRLQAQGMNPNEIYSSAVQGPEALREHDLDFSTHNKVLGLANEFKWMAEQKANAMNQYLDLAGEREARNVQARHEIGDYQAPPWLTADPLRTGNEQVIFNPQQAAESRFHPVDHNPFTTSFLPVEYDPFSLTPVDHNPFQP